jgi:hypothetical protein
MARQREARLYMINAHGNEMQRPLVPRQQLNLQEELWPDTIVYNL